MARQYNFSDMACTATDDAAHSETLPLYQGDMTISGLVPGGRTPERYESQGAWTGTRKGARAFPTVSVSGAVLATVSAWDKLVNGLTSGFTSVSTSISDYPAVDLDITWTHNAVTYQCALQDCELDSWDVSDGSPMTVSFSFTVMGPVTIEGETIITSR